MRRSPRPRRRRPVARRTAGQTLLVLARSNRLLEHKPQLALLLTLEALRLLRDLGESDTNLVHQSGREVLNVTFSNLSGIGLYGHAGRVNHLAYAPDGRTLATASSDGTVRLWDVAAVPVTPPRVLRHDGPVRRLSFAPDGRTLAVAAASDEGEVWLWDLAAPDPAARPRVLRRAERVEQLAIAPDGRTLATGHVDGVVRLWDLTAPDPAAGPLVLKGSEGSIIQLAFAQGTVPGRALRRRRRRTLGPDDLRLRRRTSRAQARRADPFRRLHPTAGPWPPPPVAASYGYGT